MRTHRTLDKDRITVALLLLITQHVDKPCPTLPEIRAQTGLPKRGILRFLAELRDRGVIEIEERGIFPGNWRRLRVTGGGWTDWTARETGRRPSARGRPPPRPSPAQRPPA
jgi:hypothetical protein